MKIEKEIEPENFHSFWKERKERIELLKSNSHLNFIATNSAILIEKYKIKDNSLGECFIPKKLSNEMIMNVYNQLLLSKMIKEKKAIHNLKDFISSKEFVEKNMNQIPPYKTIFFQLYSFSPFVKKLEIEVNAKIPIQKTTHFHHFPNTKTNLKTIKKNNYLKRIKQ